MSIGNGLAVDLMGVGIAAQPATYIGASALTTIAGVGTAQGGVVIPRTVTNVLATTSAGETALTLPADMELEVAYSVTNSSSTAALVFPFSGGAINAVAGDSSVSIGQNLTRLFIRKDATRIVSFLSA